MIIKGKSRQNGGQLGKYLFDNYKKENENVQLFEVKGTTTQDPKKAILEMSLAAELTKGKLGLYHASINPEIGENMTREDWLKSLEITEEKLGLTGQNRVSVIHEKIGEDGQKRQHMHVVWQREKNGKLISDSKNYEKHLEAQNEIEKVLGHAKTLTPKEIKEEVTKCYNEAKTGHEFIEKLKEKGYQVGKDYITEKGGKRDFCLVHPDGLKSDLVRQIERAKTKDVRQKLAGVELPNAQTIGGHEKRSNTQNEKARREGLINTAERENTGKAKKRAEQAAENFQDILQESEQEKIKELTKQEKFEQRLKAFRENSQENDKAKVAEKAAENRQDTTGKELSSFEKRLQAANENMKDFSRERNRNRR